VLQPNVVDFQDKYLEFAPKAKVKKLRDAIETA
jgi:hypothetical protein